jgi:hypothetical protein
MAKQMNYLNCRSSIQTGDIIGVEGTSFMSKVTQLVQRIGRQGEDSAVTHVGIAWWLEDRLYIVEMDGKYNVLRPLSQHAFVAPIRIWKCPVNRLRLINQFAYWTSRTIHYSITDLFKIGFRLWFGGRRSEDEDLVCSSFVGAWLRACGWDKLTTNMPSPSELSKALGPGFLRTLPEGK